MQDVETILKSANVPQEVKAQAWDIYHASANEDDFATKVQKLPIPQSVMAELWDLKHGEAATANVPEAQTTVSTTPQVEAQPTQSNLYRNLFGANPADLLSRLQGAGRYIAKGAQGIKQYGQYLRGEPVSPTPLWMEPTANPEEQIGAKAAELGVGTSLPAGGARLPGQMIMGAATGAALGAQGGNRVDATTGMLIGAAAPPIIHAAIAGAEALPRAPAAVRSLFEPTIKRPAVPAKVVREAVPEQVVKPFQPGRILEPGTPAIPPTAPQVNKWMGVASRELEFGSNPGQRLIDEGLIGKTKQATQANVNSRLSQVGNSLEKQLVAAGDSGAKVDVQTPVYDAAAEAKKLIGKKTDKAFQAAVDQVVDDIEAEGGNLADASPLTAHSVKKALGRSIDWHSTTNDPINEMKIDIYRKINAAIKNEVPGVADIQDNWSDLYIASRSLRKSLARDVAGTGTGEVPMGAPAVPPQIAPGQAPVVKPGKPAIITPEKPAVYGPSPARTITKKAIPYILGGGIGAEVMRQILSRYGRD